MTQKFDLGRRAAIAAGRLTEAGVSRAARYMTCGRCGTTVIRGLDDDRCAGEAECDVQPLTAMGELHAVIDGLRTYDIRLWGGRYELTFRDSWHMTAHPPASRPGVDVLAQHRCGRVQECTDVRRRPAKRLASKALADEPPF